MYKIWNLILLFLLISAKSFSQDPLINNWENLLNSFTERNEIADKLVQKIKKSKFINESDILLFESACQAERNMKKEEITIEMIQNVRNNNLELTKTLTRIIINLEQDSKLRKKKKVIKLQDKLILAEINLQSAKQNFNTQCEEFNRNELKF